LDGDARGGAALSIRSVTQKPIKFVGVGEKIDATTLEEFHPDRMASRILGEGDFATLLERAEAVFSEDQAEELERKLLEQEGLDFNDLLMQLEQIKNMGPLDQLVEMIPGVNKLPMKNMQVDESQLKYTKAMIQSMTPMERRNSGLLDSSRRLRIAKGSGTTVRQVNQLVDQLKFMNRMMKQPPMMDVPQLGGGGGASKIRRKPKKSKKRKRRKSR
jgi:signal recognition particle subunit SRP54